MSIQSLSAFGLILAMLSSCDAGSKLNHGEVLKGDAAYSHADAEAALESQTVAVPTSESSVAEAPPATSTPTEAVPEEEEDANQTALEPIPIGGAYLTCRYQDGQMQGSETYKMDCLVTQPVEVSLLLATVQFHKVDPQGNRTPLTILSQDLLGLLWTVEEKAATVPHNRVQITLSALGALSVTLTTTITQPLALTRNPNFWLGGEPSNTPLNGVDEDCVEYSNAAMKISHQNTTGIATGALGRMNDIACNTRYNFLCRNLSAGANAAKWMISNNEGAFTAGANACPQGYAFGIPLSEAEVREVNTLVDRNNQAMNIWVNMSDRARENEFVVLGI
ncbi:hypothetical protein [Oligoflexus tunisiensis]|uniref:hypothetical protein n=1 Tax=Oligoflexus tunisiensis TaxID=708132 RepID=UPI00114CFFB3|nr:hypothetical protein [Oligoflexus tunisiensis]